MKKNIGMALVVILFSILPDCKKLVADEIEIIYLERPPHYATVGSKATGILNDIAERIFNRAGIAHKFSVVPPKRIIRGIKEGKGQFCSPGWFRNKDRQRYAKFTLPFYQNKPLVILTHRLKAKPISKHKSVSALFRNKSLILGRMATFSYGKFIDELIDRHQPEQFVVKSSQRQLIRLIQKDRITYIIISPEEIDSLVDSVNLNREDFVKHIIPDIPVGNKRYLMCSQAVDDDKIARLNRSIRSLVKPGICKE